MDNVSVSQLPMWKNPNKQIQFKISITMCFAQLLTPHNLSKIIAIKL